MSFAQLAGKLGPMLKSVAGNQKLRGLGAKASKGALGKDGHDFFKTLRAGDFGQMSKKDLAKEFGHLAFERTKQRAVEGGRASGLDPSESPIRSTLSGFFDPETKTGKTAQSFIGSGVSASIENQLTQKAVAAGVSGAGSIATGGAKIGGRLIGGTARRIVNAPFAGQAAVAGVGALGFGAAAAGGRMLGKAGDLSGSQAGSAVGKSFAESAGEIAKNFKAIAKNPINPANWAKLAATVATLPIKFQNLGESLVSANEKLAPFSAQMALASAEFKMGEVKRNIQSAQATGSSARQMTQSLNELKDAMQPITDGVTNIAQVLLANVLEIMTSLVEYVKVLLGFISTMTDSVKSLVDWFLGKGSFQMFADAVTFGLLKADDQKNATKPMATSLQVMRNNFLGGSTMNKSDIGSWTTQTNNGTREDGTMGGSYNSPVDPNGGLSGLNDMG